MKDEYKRKEQLINDLVELRQRITELKGSETERKRVEEALDAGAVRPTCGGGALAHNR